jgi:hypothetical protein
MRRREEGEGEGQVDGWKRDNSQGRRRRRQQSVQAEGGNKRRLGAGAVWHDGKV